ncbi:MAG: pyruvate kinase [Alphaproteobacteria bacterium]|nr:pyruvate kinase [Alphaproteobacteria bacterium]
MEQSRKTKIVATLGPASSSKEMIQKLATAGADVFRLNFSHGTHDTHRQNASIIREIEQEIGKPLGIMMDLQGPKIRIGIFENGSVSLKQGAKFVLDMEKEFGNSKRVTLPHPEIFDALKEGTELLLDDGKIRLRIESNDGNKIITEVIDGGILSNKKGVNIPNAILPISALTEKDKNDVAIAGEIDADWVAISFVQTAEDVIYARKFVNAGVGILAKIEKPSAIEGIDAILSVADAIMVARGDLGVEMPCEAVPSLQKMLIDKARQHKKPVVVATQMLESMTSCHVPTRAEVSDVACAVAEGADAVGLSAESASGSFPEEAVKTMAKVALRAEADGLNFNQSFDNISTFATVVKNAVKNNEIGFVVVFTETGRSAIDISNGRPGLPIIALTPNVKTQHKLSLLWGIRAFLIDELFNFSQMIDVSKDMICKNFDVTDGAKAAIIAGSPFRTPGNTSVLYIHDIQIK